MASPKPGVSTTVRRNLTPLSSISTVDASNSTVFVVLSRRNRNYYNLNEIIVELFFITKII